MIVRGGPRALSSPQAMRDFVFLQSRPKAPLSCHVESLWYARGTVPYRRERVLPNGRVVLLINLGDPLRQEGTETGNFLGRETWISGLQSRYTINEPLGETHVAGVTFRPTGATAFFAPPMAEFSDRLTPLDAVWGAAARCLRERIGAAAGPAGVLASLEAALLERLRPEAGGLAALRYVLARLDSPEPPPLRALCGALDCSHKHLIARFRRSVGLPPKALARIVRFNRLLHAIEPRGRVRWERLAQDCGYYDQAHFNRDFRAFAGLTPSRYLAERRLAFGAALAAGENPQFVPYSDTA